MRDRRIPRLERWRRAIAMVTKLVHELVHLTDALIELAVRCRRLAYIAAPLVLAVLSALR